MSGATRTTPRGRVGRGVRATIVGIVALIGLTGCGLTSVQEVPLPGGAALGDDPIRVIVQLDNALDLVPNASARTNNVPIGVVREVRLAPDGWTAEAVIDVNGDTILPANPAASLRQTSLLGEKFVELANPTTEPPRGRLTDGTVVPLSRTEVGAQVEEVLGALSLLLNGGGVEKVQTISRELNAALNGNEERIRSLIANLNVFVGTLDAQRGDIVRAIDSLDRLTASLVTQRARIANVLENLQPGLDVLNSQRALLVEALQSLARLGVVATDVIENSQENLVADLRALQPILANLILAGDALPGSLEILFTIPFADNSLDTIKGDFANISINLNLSLAGLLTNILDGGQTIPGVDGVFAMLSDPAAPLIGGQPVASPVDPLTGLPRAVLPGLTGDGTEGPDGGTGEPAPAEGAPDAGDGGDGAVEGSDDPVADEGN